MKRIVIIAEALSICLLCGCSSNDKQAKTNIEKLMESGRSECNVVDIYSGKVVNYSTENCRTLNEYFADSDYFCYDCPQFEGYYTAGDSLEYGFSLFKLQEGTFQTLYHCEDMTGLFPIAEEGDYLIFNECTYDEDYLLVDSAIVSYNPGSGQMEKYDHTCGMIADGAIVGDYLYYTVYDEADDAYQCYQLDLKDTQSLPALLDDWNRSESRVLAYDNRLLYITDNKIQIGDSKIVCGSDMYIIGRQLINYRIISDERYAADIYDLDTGEKTDTCDFPTGFIEVGEDGTYTLACEGRIYTSD